MKVLSLRCFKDISGQYTESVTPFLSPAPSGKIEQVNHRDVTSSSAVITWSEMPCTRRGSSIANYAVYIRDAATGRRVTAAGTNTLDVKVGELRPFTQYTAEVVFSNGVSETEPSDTHSFQTAEGRKCNCLFKT